MYIRIYQDLMRRTQKIIRIHTEMLCSHISSKFCIHIKTIMLTQEIPVSRMHVLKYMYITNTK